MLEIDENDLLSGIRYLNSTNVDFQSITTFICHIYGMKHHQDINKARYESFMKMTGRKKVLA